MVTHMDLIKFSGSQNKTNTYEYESDLQRVGKLDGDHREMGKSGRSVWSVYTINMYEAVYEQV